MERLPDAAEFLLHTMNEDTMSVSSDCSDTDSNSVQGEYGPSIYGNDEPANKEQLAHRETRAVFRLRVLVILVLICAAMAVSVVVYFITKSSEVDEFNTQWNGSGEKIVEAFQGIVRQKLGAISSVGVASIAHGVDHSRSWPFVTLSSFQQRSSTARSLSDALFVSINPFVHETQRTEWEEYVVSSDSYWIDEGFVYQEQLGLDGFEKSASNGTVSPQIYYLNNDDKVVIEASRAGPYMPVWQTSPVLKRPFINQNIFHNSLYAEGARTCLETEMVVIGRFDTAPEGDASHPHTLTSFYASLLSIAAEEAVSYQGDPVSQVYLPVFSSFQTSRVPVAVMMAVIHWSAYFKNVLPPNVPGIIAVLDNSCDEAFTIQIDGEEVRPIGPGDQHTHKFNYLEKHASFAENLNIADGTKYGLNLNQDECPVTLKVYPSQSYYDTYNTNTPAIVTLSVAIVFVITVLCFLGYDRLVERRQNIVLSKATTSTAIVSSLFPSNVRDRLMQERQTNTESRGGVLMAPTHRLKSFLSEYTKDGEASGLQQPIADLFPHTTVLFADIAGFTAWSSTREPVQVFILLQTLYQAFDSLANRRKVWKVETIGDSYVAVTGLPYPQERHAVIMTRFAGECMLEMKKIASLLEVTLGPDTGDLSMRFGIHSGPVTAGVLRGDRARFQLFGDTVNTAARMESTGRVNCIQCSQATADLLVEAGKGHWVRPRSESVEAKGKGKMSTFWLSPFAKRGASSVSSQNSIEHFPRRLSSDLTRQDSTSVVKQERLVDWICELLQEHIKVIMATSLNTPGGNRRASKLSYKPANGKTALDEVAEVICLPEFNPKIAAAQKSNPSLIQINATVSSQLRDYVAMIASTYHNNPFHNFEHACHVTMSVSKLLKRIVTPDVELGQLQEAEAGRDKGALASQIHDYTLGINSDPLCQFAIVLAALIHDADHPGVSNTQLIEENKELAKIYKKKSVAEQHSFDLAWQLFMSDRFAELRNCLFSSKAELLRFRQVIVNVVMATDIFDVALNDLRKARWQKAFSDDSKDSGLDVNNLRATIVLEHIIQASDVSHTMQHWHVYRKWNKKLFQEMSLAYRAGRMGTDPATFWYKGELAFFDNYIIPLANKLKECKIFGVSSDEYLNYALQNRAEWEVRGEEIVAEMMDEILYYNTKSPRHPRRFSRRGSSTRSETKDEEKKDEGTGIEIPFEFSHDTSRVD